MEKENFQKFVSKKETLYFALMLIISLLFYIILFIGLIGIIYIMAIGLFLFITQGLAIGHIRQNSVKITENHFGDIYAKIKQYSEILSLETIPDVYLMQSGGVLNAFATRFLFQDVIVIYSDILELAYEQGENAVNFIIAHELAHIKRNHLSKMKYIACAMIIPFLNSAYSRACETTCDRIAMELTKELPIDGLLVLVAGTKLYKKVDTKLFVTNAEAEKGFWGWFAEICSSHPNLATRIKNLANIDVPKITDNIKHSSTLY